MAASEEIRRIVDEAEDLGFSGASLIQSLRAVLPNDADDTPPQEKKKRKKNKKKKQCQRRRPLLDGMGAGARGDWQLIQWRPMPIPPGADPLPHTPTGARLWLANRKHTGGHATVIATGSTKHSVVRRCVSHAAVVKSGVWRACGCMWRMDSKNGWAPYVRVADLGWSGEHLDGTDADDDVATAKTRTNAAFSARTEEYIRQEITKGRKARQIFGDLCEQMIEGQSAEDRLRMAGREAIQEALGFTLRQVQWFVSRVRRSSGHGYYVRSVTEMKVGRNKHMIYICNTYVFHMYDICHTHNIHV